MTEPVKQDGELNQQTPVTAVNDGVPSTTPKTVEEEAWWKEASEKHGFKSKEDVYKSWSNANQKISDQGEQLKNFETFQNQVVPVLDIVLGDEEILGKVQTKMGIPVSIPKKPDVSVKNETPPIDTETKKWATDSIVHSFEESHGITKLDEATQKEIKAKVGQELKKFTNSKDVNVNLLSGQLDDAFKLVLSRDEKLRNVFEPKDDSLGDYGSLPSQSSGLDKDGQIKLTPEELKVADNMPGGREAYIQGKKKILGK